MRHITVEGFEDWRQAARSLLAQKVPPEQVQWTVRGAQSQSFFPSDPDSELRNTEPQSNHPARLYRVPREFVQLAELVACHRHASRWRLLYSILWRLVHNEPDLLEQEIDDVIYAARRMEKAVRRDLHKMKAFVRFRRTDQTAIEETGADERDSQRALENRQIIDEQESAWYLAWHKPDHRILRLAAPFFARRFSTMRWAILTPEESVTWNRSQLQFGPGMPASAAPTGDALEELWKTYYRSTFNPARVNVRLMRREMPVRHWPTLPETQIIDDLLREAPGRVEAMIRHKEGTTTSARDFLPEERDLQSLAEAAQHCRGCDLYKRATQAVFGEGPSKVKVMFVGEQPGDQEDLQGRPFVGPAGQLLDKAMEQAGIDRSEAYVTNAVKHFKWEPRGKRRLHSKPNAREMSACRPWLEAEMQTIHPQIVVCLGATAAQSLLGPSFRITRQRGHVLQSDWGVPILATYHPSALLRAPDEVARAEMHRMFLSDLKTVAKFIAGSPATKAASGKSKPATTARRKPR